MKLYKLLALGLSLSLVEMLGCSGADNSTGGNDTSTSDPVTGVTVADIANNGNGQDLQVSFNKAADESKVQEYRVIVSKSAGLGGLTVTTASAGTFAITNGLSLPSAPFTLGKTNLVVTLTDVIQAGSGGLAVDKNGNIFAADFGASLSSPPGTRIFKITPDGDVSLFASGFVGASGNHESCTSK